MAELLLVFVAIYVLNLIPAFAPPTWMAMTVIGFNSPGLPPLILALTAAVAATTGRITLAKLSEVLVRNHWLSAATRQNVDVLKEMLERHKKTTVGGLVLYAFSPLPTNYLFIAYGLTALPLRLIALPFFIGRSISYAFWIIVAQQAAQKLASELDGMGSYLGGYFIVTQLLLLVLVYLFVRIDWRHLFMVRRLRLLRASEQQETPGDKG